MLKPRWLRTLRLGVEESDKFPAVVRYLYEAAGGAPFIDLGCGECVLTKGLNGVFVDLEKRAGSPDEVQLMDIRQVPAKLYGQRFTLMVMIDVIEHLTSNDGMLLLGAMETRCEAMLIFTPTGDLWSDPKAVDPHLHKSAWTPEEFYVNGWTIWEWPIFHSFAEGHRHGAFWAWKFHNPFKRPTPELVAKAAGIML